MDNTRKKKRVDVKRFKDLVYDYNDIVVALLIVAVAGAIIAWRIGVIADYPKYLAAIHAGQEQDPGFDDLDLTEIETDDNLNENPDEIETDPDVKTPAGPESETEQSGGQTTPPVASGVFKTKNEAAFTVPAGVTASKIAQLLYDAHLVESKEAFLSAIARANAETHLKAGTFTVPAGSTADDVVRILTK